MWLDGMMFGQISHYWQAGETEVNHTGEFSCTDLSEALPKWGRDLPIHWTQHVFHILPNHIGSRITSEQAEDVCGYRGQTG